MSIFSWLLARFKERSTWVGITGLLATAGVILTPEQSDIIATAGAAVAGAILVFFPDKAPPAPPAA
jgi:hypothetical protein